LDRWNPDVHRAAFVAALDNEIAQVELPRDLDREYTQLINSLDPFDFEALVATMMTRVGYTDVSTLMKGGDEGIDVLGRFPARLLTFNVGAQCKHSKNPKFAVGRPVLDRLRTALQRYNCQSGFLVTNARVGSGTLEAQVAYDKYPIPVRCIDGEALRKLLFAGRVGVRESHPGEYLVDPTIWRDQFNLGDVQRTVSTAYVPQADKLSLVKKVVHLVSEGYTTRSAVARGLGYAPRQGHYYAVAAEALDLVRLDPGNLLSITEAGNKLLMSAGDERAERAILRDGLRKIPVYERMLTFMQRTKGQPIPHSHLMEAWKESSRLKGSTAPRRLLTLLSWFEELGIITRQGGGAKVVVRFQKAP
jgi:hypothetical protein